MSRKFKYEIGTRVTHEGFGNGTIIDRDCRDCSVVEPYLVEFDSANFRLHDGDTSAIIGEKKKKGKNDHCWWCNERDLRPIKTEFDWNAFINDKIAVHLDTQEKYDAFMKECEKRGLNWCFHKATGWNNFNVYKSETAVTYGYAGNNHLQYSPCEFYRSEGWSVCEYEIPVESKPASWKVIIEGNGDVTTAKYIEGKNLVKTETVKRYYTDEYSVFKAIEALNNKMFGEKTEEVKVEEPKFKPGDLVEVVKDCDRCPSGLRGHIVSEYACICDDNKWWLVDFHVEYEFTHSACNSGCRLPERTGYYIKENCLQKCLRKVEK